MSVSHDACHTISYFRNRSGALRNGCPHGGRRFSGMWRRTTTRWHTTPTPCVACQVIDGNRDVLDEDTMGKNQDQGGKARMDLVTHLLCSINHEAPRSIRGVATLFTWARPLAGSNAANYGTMDAVVRLNRSGASINRIRQLVR
jgi:hypothetical protein